MCTWAKVLSDEEARHKWAEWEAQEEVSKDPEGALYMQRDNNELYVPVPVHTEMNFRTSLKRLNEVTATTSVEKNVSQERLDALVGKVGMHLDKMGSTEVHLGSLAKQTLATCGSNPLASGSDVSMAFTDVQALLPQEDADSNEDEEEHEDNLPGEEGQESGAPNKKKKERKAGEWWARDEFIIKKEAELETLISTSELALQSPYNELKKEVEAPCDVCSLRL